MMSESQEDNERWGWAGWDRPDPETLSVAELEEIVAEQQITPW